MWWAIPTFITGGVGEIIGWSARVWSSKAPLLDTPFMMQYVSSDTFQKHPSHATLTGLPQLSSVPLFSWQQISSSPEGSLLALVQSTADWSRDYVRLSYNIPFQPSNWPWILTDTIIFCTCDAVALVVQAVGGATASSANDQKGTKLGANIMLGGIIFQLSKSEMLPFGLDN